MSGPITAGYFIFHGVLLLSARAIEEARAMRREYHDVLAQLTERERALTEARQGQRNARLERIAALRQSAERLGARHARLHSLGDALAAPSAALRQQLDTALPAPPADDGDTAWTEHVRRLEVLVRELETALAAAGDTHGERLRAALAATVATPGIDEVLAAYVLQRQMRAGLSTEDAERFRQTAHRVLARLELPEGAALPAELEALARAIVMAPTIERAEALASELRLAVQRQREGHALQAHDTAEARRLIGELPEDAPAPLLHSLEQVAAGVARLDPALREATQAALDHAAADRAQAEDAAAALVLQESLRDLGYEVEDIQSTLFADGGTVHFRRKGWDQYFVRLRLDPHERTVNFNVVRARGAEETDERRRLDALAEDRWCAEFPRLMQTLAARGLELSVTRRLEAGAVPVQVVDGAQLPAIAAEDDVGEPRGKPRALEQP
jgi:hypothetical protein